MHTRQLTTIHTRQLTTIHTRQLQKYTQLQQYEYTKTTTYIFWDTPHLGRSLFSELYKIMVQLTSSSAPGIEKFRNGGVRPFTNWNILFLFLNHSTRCSWSRSTLYSHCSKAEPPSITYRGTLSSTTKRFMASATEDKGQCSNK